MRVSWCDMSRKRRAVRLTVMLPAMALFGCAAALHEQVDIAARPAIVWDVLTDLARYPEWNPFTPRVEGALAIGERVTLHVALIPGRPPKTQRQRILDVDRKRLLTWETRLLHPALLRARRDQTLYAVAVGTRYTATDSLSGALVPLVMRLYRGDLERGFRAMTIALKARSEAIAAAIDRGEAQPPPP